MPFLCLCCQGYSSIHRLDLKQVAQDFLPSKPELNYLATSTWLTPIFFLALPSQSFAIYELLCYRDSLHDTVALIGTSPCDCLGV